MSGKRLTRWILFWRGISARRLATYAVCLTIVIMSVFVALRKYPPTRKIIKELTAAVKTTVTPKDPLVSLADKDPWVQSQAAAELTRAGKSVVPKLIQALNGAEASTRWWIVTVLGDIGADSIEALPLLLKRFEEEPEVSIKCALATAAGQIGDAQAVPFLLKYLDDKDERVRASGAAALGKIRFAPSEAVGALSELLLDDDHAVHVAARGSFIRLQHEAASARAPSNKIRR